MNTLQSLMTRLGVSVGVVMAASGTIGVRYAWQICLLCNNWKTMIWYKHTYLPQTYTANGLGIDKMRYSLLQTNVQQN